MNVATIATILGVDNADKMNLGLFELNITTSGATSRIGTSGIDVSMMAYALGSRALEAWQNSRTMPVTEQSILMIEEIPLEELSTEEAMREALRRIGLNPDSEVLQELVYLLHIGQNVDNEIFTDEMRNENRPRSSHDEASESSENYYLGIHFLRTFATANLRQPYISRINDCDIWVENVLVLAGVDPLDYFVGPARSHTVESHINNALERGVIPIERRAPNIRLLEGIYVVFMGDSPRNFEEHAGLLFVNRNGTVDFFHTSSWGTAMSVMLSYDSVRAFQGDFSYNLFYYQRIQR
ncbi:MAG: hypothetical protein FWD87_00605 [Spirochaetaceae bacterium]|nr:hypothetical protein [Spirochaetaceae bacterium]